jgi:hypothetical protein
MKVVVLSAYRSATQSTDLLLKNLGYKTIHYGGNMIRTRSESSDDIFNEIHKKIHKYDAFLDNPFPVMYEHFDTQYPGSKFILIKRDPDSWYNSILAINEYLKKSKIDPFEKTFFDAYLDKVPTLFKDIPHKDYILCYNRHIEAVENYFKDKDNLLILDISNSKKGIKIANFLNKDIFPKVDFIK